MKHIWKEFEADAWFKRNGHVLSDDYANRDLTFELLSIYDLKPEKVIELGAANGYRVNLINEKYKCELAYAVEPSNLAIEAGKLKYPKINFINSTCEEVELPFKFDLVILGFFMCCVDRKNILSCIKSIDALVEDNGILIINDFYSESYIKRNYKHVNDSFMYKVNYSDLFIKTGTYIEVSSFLYDTNTSKLSTNLGLDNMGKITFLKKQDHFILKE